MMPELEPKQLPVRLPEHEPLRIEHIYIKIITCIHVTENQHD